METTTNRRDLLRQWAAWNDRKMECHGTDEAVEAAQRANAILDELGDMTEADWGVIRLAQREYVREEA